MLYFRSLPINYTTTLVAAFKATSNVQYITITVSTYNSPATPKADQRSWLD